MKTEIKLIFEKHQSGTKLGEDEIRTLMIYCLELLGDFERLTKDSINRAHQLLSEQYKRAA